MKKTDLLILFPERLFLIFAFIFGTSLVILIPPFQSPDEFNHFFRAWQVSEGNFSPEKTNNQRLGGNLPISLDSLKNNFLLLKNNYAATTSKSKILTAAQIPLKSTERKFIDFPNTAIYAPTAYVPQSIGIWIGRFCECSPLLIFYLSRWMNLLFSIAIIYQAIKIMPFHQWTLVFCALLPSSLVIAASLNADVVSNALCFWLIAHFLGDNKNTVLGFLTTMLITVNKLVFAPFILLQKAKMWTTRNYQHYFYALLTFSVVLILFWSNNSKTMFIPFDNYNPAYRELLTLNEGVNPAQQIDFIGNHPLEFSKIVLKSFAQSLPSTATHLVGKFGWEKNYLPTWDILLLWMGLVVLAFSQKNPLNPQNKRWILGCILSCLFLFSITMYALWCPVGSPILLNLQGRYFLPLLPLGIILVGKNIFCDLPRILYGICLIWVISNLLLFHTIINRYYS
jgi:uncharacterized membrane protein